MRTLSIWCIRGLIRRYGVVPAPQTISSLHLDNAVLACRLCGVPIMVSPIRTGAIPFGLALALPAPTLGSHITANTNADAPGALVASGTPCPAGSTRDGQVIPAECEPRCRNADQTTKQQVKPKVPEIGKSRASHVDRCADGCEDECECVNRWSSGLVTNGYNCFVLAKTGG